MCLLMEKKIRLNRPVGSDLGPNCLQRLSANRLTKAKQTTGPRSFVPENTNNDNTMHFIFDSNLPISFHLNETALRLSWRARGQ